MYFLNVCSYSRRILYWPPPQLLIQCVFAEDVRYNLFLIQDNLIYLHIFKTILNTKKSCLYLFTIVFLSIYQVRELSVFFFWKRKYSCIINYQHWFFFYYLIIVSSSSCCTCHSYTTLCIYVNMILAIQLPNYRRQANKPNPTQKTILHQ